MSDIRDASLAEQGEARIAWALNGLIRAIPFQAAQRRCYLPKAMTDAHGLTLNGLYAGSGDQNLAKVVSALADIAHQHVEQAFPDSSKMVPRTRPAFAGLRLVVADLKRLNSAGYDVYSARPLGPLRRRWLLSTGNTLKI